MIGQTISHYKITAKLGEGGMGEVYVATDLKLDREVALKFLPPHLSADPEFLSRFQHEAKAAAALSHPNIVTVYEFGEHEGRQFMALELVEGQTLEALIKSGDLPLPKCLETAIQICDGLAAAHHAGIIHRDIKPANILVDKSDRVRILDFGLAKSRRATTETRVGTTVGTVQYESPEQSRGEQVDHRSDIFSFGVVLYEMIAGRTPFPGEIVEAIRYAIAHEAPEPLARYRANVPDDLQRIVSKCLAKEPRARYQNIEEVPVDLRAIDLSAAAVGARISRPPAPAERQVRPPLWRLALPWSVAAVGVILAVWGLVRTAKAPRAPVERFTTYLSGADRQSGYSPSFALSPDGRKLVYTSPYETTSQLFLRDLDKDDSRPLPGTERGDEPFFSPDGEWVGFFANGELKKLYLNGGKPVTLCQAVGSGCWGEDDTIFFCRAWSEGLWKISVDGGNPIQVTKPNHDAGEFGHFLPEVLPGGAAVLFTVWHTTLKDAAVDILLLKTGERRTLVTGGSGARYVPTGHLVYAQMGALVAAPFDLNTLSLGELRLPVIEEINQVQGYGSARLSFSPAGTLVYERGGSWSARRQFVWISRSGECQPLPGVPSGSYSGFALSPDGRRLAFTKFADGADNIWVHELDGGRVTQVTSKSGNYNPIWSPDGHWLAFTSYRLGPFSVWRVPADQSGPEECLLAGPCDLGALCWSPDGRSLLYYRDDPSTRSDIWRLSIGGDSTSAPLLTESYSESGAALSPSGRLLAYGSDQSGRWEVYVRAYPVLGGILWNSTGGGVSVCWSRDGRELFYGIGEKLIAVPILSESPFQAGAPVVLLEGKYRGLDPAPDGRFLTLRDEKEAVPTELVVVVNWFDELKRLVPTGK